jgi:hypothetical protein
MANTTGGTAAPSIRMNAAARALGAPKVTGQRAQRTTPGRPRLPGVGAPQRGITQHQTAPQRAPQQHAARAAAPKAPARSLTAFDPSQGMYKEGQLSKLAQNITRENAQTQLQPLRQQAKEITGAEGTALNRYQGMAQTGQQVLQGLQTGEEASAKTAQNNAAEAAIQASKQIETSGQNAATATAGYLDPQVQQALAASQSTAAGLGGSAAAFQQAMGVSGSNLISNLRAAAAQRVTEGGARIAEGYQGAQAKNADEQQRILGKQPTEAKSLASELGQKQFTDELTARSLGVKEGTLGVDKQKAATEKAFKAGELHNAAQKNQISLSLGREKNATTREKTQATLRADEAKNATAINQAQIRAKAQIDVANKKAGRLTTSEEDKAVGELSSAYAVIQQLRTQKVSPAEIREGLTKGGLTVKEKVNGKEKVGKEKLPTIKNQALVTAAMELWNYHRINGATERQLTKAGIQVPQEWVNGTFKGF